MGADVNQRALKLEEEITDMKEKVIRLQRWAEARGGRGGCSVGREEAEMEEEDEGCG